MESKIDMSNLARMMLRWEKLQLQADELRGAIEDTVMRIKRTQTVGNVRATYSAGRKSYDYATAAKNCPQVTEYIYAVAPNDWRKICQHVGIEEGEIPFTQSGPTVRMELLPVE